MKDKKEKNKNTNKDKNDKKLKLINNQKNVKENKIDCKIPQNEKDVEGLEYFAE